MRRQLAVYVLCFSLVANLFLGLQLYNRDLTLNQVTWGNAVSDLWKHVNWASISVTARSDGRVMGPDLEGLSEALEDLEALQYLPFYGQRASFEDVNTLRQFLRYTGLAYALALKEQGDTGTVSAESADRLQRIHEGLELVLQANERTNQLTNARKPWSHAPWRDLWREIAENLRQLDFVPLPE
ncbi:MAG TPA: hypothetical protein VD969_03330 [Symbiobacteriaceae bacterium]|nr:hypothetical protein [Symbiobacteriaceae bacterium]